MSIRRLLVSPDMAHQLSGLADSPTLRWPAVAARYRSLAARLVHNRHPVTTGVPA